LSSNVARAVSTPPGSAYWRRIQRALDYIAANLDQSIQLADVAEAAAFSEYHFHRIFRAVMDETVGEYVTRQRMQTAALMLAYHEDLPITQVALACGYSSSSNFSKAFSRFFGVSPSEVRKPSGKPAAAISVLRQRYGHDFSPGDLHTLPDPPQVDARLAELEASVRFERWDAFAVVCMRSDRGYDVAANTRLWVELIQRVRALELCGDEIDAYAITYDDPALTSSERCRYHACVRVTGIGGAPPEPLFMAEIPDGRYAVFPYRGPGSEIGRMYRDIYALWFPHSSLAPDTPPPIEHYIHDEPDEHGVIDMEIAIKVRRLR
jgi:AraC family transcriptional regulator